jgi:hypothetical protein
VAGVLCLYVTPCHTCDQLLQGVQICVTDLQVVERSAGAATE